VSFRAERSEVEESLFSGGRKDRCLDKLGMTAHCIAYAEANQAAFGVRCEGAAGGI